jgi:hypothetical protein
VEGGEQSLVRADLADAGLPPVVGVRSYQVFRASKDVPEICDGKGWTYHHHVDMACWKGKLYVAWNSCERDEDVWPSRELYATSDDGANWTSPRELFPQGVSTCLRMYFYLASTGRMLVIAGLRRDTADTDEDTKGGLIVREILANHELGDVYLLQPDIPHAIPHYTTCSDQAFVASCSALLADTVYLEQQDRGRLLGDRRMKWHEPAAWPGGKVPGDDEKWVAGKAFSFFDRGNEIVGVSKMGWTTISRDGGRTWDQPCVPPTLITGKAKVWAQQTEDGRFALAYNPSTRQRFPLTIVTSDDGYTFGDMRIVQGELPVQRYAGKFRSIGPQYTRGISKWSDDGSRRDNAIWLVYSMSKEDIWVSRIPLPVKPDATSFDEPWNIYQPKWASVTERDGVITLCSRDPYDYATITRVIPETCGVISLKMRVREISRPIEIDLLAKYGSRRLIRARLTETGMLQVEDETQPVSTSRFKIGEWLSIKLDACSCDSPVHRFTIRTGPFRNIGKQNPVAPGTDRQTDLTSVEVKGARVEK